MTWTINRRITTGFALAALLVVAIALTGIWALRQTAGTYAEAISAERTVLLRAMEARRNLANANVAYLRILVSEVGVTEQDRAEAVEQTRTLLTELRETAEGDQTQVWTEALRLLEEWDEATARVIELSAAGTTAEALEIRQNEVVPTRARLEEILERNVQTSLADADEIQTNAAARAGASEMAIVVALLLALGIFVITAYLLNRAVSGPLQETSNVLATSAAEILSTTTQQASGATESLAAVTQTAATVDQVVQTADQSSERARSVAATAQRAAEIGRQGREAIDTTVSGINDVREQVASIQERMVELTEQAQAIGEIIATVSDLAEQTNLLALNAAIEAARAGEQGRGFAVVAGEVKNLAEQSKAGTVRVRQILEQVQRATTAAVSVTEQGNRKVNDVSRQVTEAGETIRRLAEAVSTASQAAAQISASAGQQSTGMSQIKQAIGSIQQAAQQNLAATRQAESAAQELNRLGSHLIDLVGTGGPSKARA
ncbi:MAG TPA: methyl-accepting chemotaxis protein [Longimicrobiales bacterium]|nr:methyl-accepting chemotaxis protein [Longimicrobiales bacterium]